MPPAQARWWILTIPHAHFLPYQPPAVKFIRGQLELGAGGFLHWQLIVHFRQPSRLAAVRALFGDFHAEPTRSAAALEYVWKEDTRVPNTQFELGEMPVNRAVAADWDRVRTAARAGELDAIPADIYVRNYSNLKRIAVDHMEPVALVREVYVFWGRTGTGKSRRAWAESGLDAYPKDPRSKFWDGYRGQESVVVDEFRGGIDISHLLRWLDRYPVIVEVKGSSVVLRATKLWITSNISPDDWYPELDAETKAALRRRFTQVVHFN